MHSNTISYTTFDEGPMVFFFVFFFKCSCANIFKAFQNLFSFNHIADSGQSKTSFPQVLTHFHASLYGLIARSLFLSCIKLRRAGVKVETWNVIRLFPNLQLQIVWNWFGVLALFWQSHCNWMHFLVKGDKGNPGLGNWIVIAVYLFRLIAQRCNLEGIITSLLRV